MQIAPSTFPLFGTTGSKTHAELSPRNTAADSNTGDDGSSNREKQTINHGATHLWQPRGLGALAQLSSRLRRPPGEELPLTYRWVKGMVSNLDYLLAINVAAGRVLGDRLRHPIVPWVSDLLDKVSDDGELLDGVGGLAAAAVPTSATDRRREGWRDLTMTKFRLKKGDAQLDQSYAKAHPRHHIPESLSDLTLTVYLARRLPLQVRRKLTGVRWLSPGGFAKSRLTVCYSTLLSAY